MGRPAAARWLGLQVTRTKPPVAWLSLVSALLSDSRLYDGPMPRPEES